MPGSLTLKSFDSRSILSTLVHPGADQPVTAYIQRSWDLLIRSMNEYASLVDPKIVSQPVLYLPADITLPAEVVELYDRSRVQVYPLPRIIEKIGDVRPEQLAAPGLLYLPNPYVVPGGRFNEMYGWDSYFIVLGLIASGRYGLARGMVENFFFEIMHYGTVLNANRTYCLTRSHPPFLTSMIRAVYECRQCFGEGEASITWLERAYRLAARDYAMWAAPHRRAGETGLTRYFDLDCTQVPELADDSRYFHDVIEWLLAHPRQDPGYLVQDDRSPSDKVREIQSARRDRELAAGGLSVPASVKGRSLAEDFYRGDRAMRESGFDSSFRFGVFCGKTHHFAPVCLNSLLYRYERDMSEFAHELRLTKDAEKWDTIAQERAAHIQQYLWHEEQGLFQDYDFVREKASEYNYLSTFYPMWAGLATPEQAECLRRNLRLFERPGGLAMSTQASGMQWDEPYGWAPCNLIAAEGMRAYGFRDDALRIARAFISTVDRGFEEDATVREKYHMVRGDAEVHVTAGYKDNVIGFGWTNAVYLKMKEMLLAGGE